MARKIDITGQAGKTYDLEKLSTEGTRTSSSEELLVQVWEWNPKRIGDHKEPNPPTPKIGQIWLSKFVNE